LKSIALSPTQSLLNPSPNIFPFTTQHHQKNHPNSHPTFNINTLHMPDEDLTKEAEQKPRHGNPHTHTGER
jgi:hypothetical protein